MECGDANAKDTLNVNNESQSVNSLILDYYKKFGRKRDLEQYFSLSTAQSDIKDRTSLFWQKMKSLTDSDSGEKDEESSKELCRISIKCTVPEISESHVDRVQSDADSPPIITAQNTDNDSVKSDENESQKSTDMALNTSANKQVSPTSSITSQRKLEWDSLADVGYANETDRKNSASSLSTLERLALKQQYSNNENNDNNSRSNLGLPTAHSTPYETENVESKLKKNKSKKVTKISQRAVDHIELDELNSTSILNVNLNKHISLNFEKNGGVTCQTIKNEVSSTKDKVLTEIPTKHNIDKEIQTTLSKKKNSSNCVQGNSLKSPVVVSVKKMQRKRKFKTAKRRIKQKMKNVDEKKDDTKNKNGVQLSDAESFEYMPGHMFDEREFNRNKQISTENKSSVDSSSVPTTDSSKESKHSFSSDLQKSIDILKSALKECFTDSIHKRKLVKEVVQRLLNSKYKEDENPTEFLSGLTLDCRTRHLNKKEITGTTTSDSANSVEYNPCKPKKSILRKNHFHSIPSTSQSVPNLTSALKSDKYLSTKLVEHQVGTNLGDQQVITNSDTDQSSREKLSSDIPFSKSSKLSSEELYLKYIEALRKENAYKMHLKDNEIFMKKKLSSSDSLNKCTSELNLKSNKNLSELIKYLIRHNHDDGSGDACKVEGESNGNFDMNKLDILKKQKSHSVFTLSSCNSEVKEKKANQQKFITSAEVSNHGNRHTESNKQCCCPYHSAKLNFCVKDSSAQVDLSFPCNTERQNVNIASKDKETLCVKCKIPTQVEKYVCPCEIQNMIIHKCSECLKEKLSNESNPPFKYHEDSYPHDHLDKNNVKEKNKSCASDRQSFMENKCIISRGTRDSGHIPLKRMSRSSQTNLNLALNLEKNSDKSVVSWSSEDRKFEIVSKLRNFSDSLEGACIDDEIIIYESTRWIQTDISINPRISNSTLSDIEIIKSNDCASLVHQSCRKVAKLKASSDFKSLSASKTTNTDDNMPATDSVLPQNLKIDLKSDEISSKASKPKNREMIIGQKNESKKISENLILPIIGTNMTLMVRINQNNLGNEEQTLIHHGTVTEKEVDNKGTCLREECSKAVQSESTEVFSKINKDTVVQEVLISDKQNLIFDPEMMTKHEYVTNTYPKALPRTNPLIRSSSDSKHTYSSHSIEQMENENMHSVETKYSSINQILSEKTVGIKEDEVHKTNIENTYADKVMPNRGFNEQTFLEQNKNMDSVNKGFCVSCMIENCKCNIYDKNKSVKKTNRENEKLLIEGKFKNIENKIDKRSDIANVNCQSSDRSRNLRKKEFYKRNKSKYDSLYPNSTAVQHAITPFKLMEEEHKIKTDVDNQSDKTCSNHSQQLTISSSQSGSNIAEPLEKGNKKYIKNLSNKNSEISGESSRFTISNDANCDFDSDERSKKSSSGDPVLEMINDITNRYNKKDIKKNSKKKRYKEIMALLGYLLDTESSTDQENTKRKESNEIAKNLNEGKKSTEIRDNFCQTKNVVDRAVGTSFVKKSRKNYICHESSDILVSTDIPKTSSDSETCKVLEKIKRECEKYHHRRCKCHYSSGKRCDASSSTSMNCDHCKRKHSCSCKAHKCKSHKKKLLTDKIENKGIAYNLIIQTSDSMINEDSQKSSDKRNDLRNIVIKIPSKRCHLEKLPFKEVSSRIERRISSPHLSNQRSMDLPNERESPLSSLEEKVEKDTVGTVRDYLEQNRPDFVENCNKRQNCLKTISERRYEECCSPTSMKMFVVHTPSYVDKLGCYNNTVFCARGWC